MARERLTAAVTPERPSSRDRYSSWLHLARDGQMVTWLGRPETGFGTVLQGRENYFQAGGGGARMTFAGVVHYTQKPMGLPQSFLTVCKAFILHPLAFPPIKRNENNQSSNFSIWADGCGAPSPAPMLL